MGSVFARRFQAPSFQTFQTVPSRVFDPPVQPRDAFIPRSQSEVNSMKSNRSLIAAVIFLAAGLGMIFVYCNGTTSMNVGYPFAGSALHVAITTTGPAAVGGVALALLGLLLLIWAFIWAIVEVGRT